MAQPLPRLGIAAIAGGGAVAVALVAWFGAQSIGAEVLRAAWVLPLTVALHALQLLLSAVAWRGLAGPPAPQLPAWWRIRWVREAVNAMLPVAQIGGNLAAIRLLAQRGLPVARATAATVLDLTVEALAQFLFTLLGIAVLAAIGQNQAWRPWLGGGMALMGAGIAGFVLAAGLFGIPPDAAVALSMVKRVRELAVGLPGLLAWQWTETARLRRRAG